MPRPSKIKVVSKQEVGQRIRALRQDRAMSQSRLAQLLETTQPNISGLERGTRSLTVHQVVRIAKALHVSTDEILLGAKTKANGSIARDRRFVRRLERIDELPDRKKQALLTTIDAFLNEGRE